jgi:hypothetical protein
MGVSGGEIAVASADVYRFDGPANEATMTKSYPLCKWDG